MPSRNIFKVSSLNDVKYWPNGAGVGVIGNSLFMNTDGTPRLISAALGGRSYFVDLTRGDDTNHDGLSPETPYAQLTTAITASEVYRAAQTNVYLRNTIYVFGQANTAYNALTAYPNYTDVIGVGGDFKGDMTGTVVVGLSTTSNGTNALEMRGSNFYNMQFRGGGTSQSAFLISKLLRCQFIDCAFFNKGAACDAGVYVETLGAHNTFRNCWIGDTNATATYGMYIKSTGNWDHCLIEDCFITGSTAAYYTAAYLQNGTVVRNNTCIGGTNGIVDATTETTLAGNAFYVSNYCYGSQSTAANAGGMKVTVNPTLRCFGNYCSDGGTGHVYLTNV